MYASKIVTPRRGRPVVRWKDRVKDYMHEIVVDRTGGIELARREREVKALLPWLSP